MKIKLAVIASLLALPALAVADDLMIDDFTVGEFTTTNNANGNGSGGSFLTGLSPDHVLGGMRIATIAGSGTGVSTMSVANAEFTVDATQANFSSLFELSYGGRSGPGQEMFRQYALNSDWDAIGVESLVIDVQEFTASSPIRLWVFLQSNMRPHPSFEGWVDSDNAEVVFDFAPAPGGTQLVFSRSDFLNLSAVPLNWADIDGLRIQTLTNGHIPPGGELIINDVYAMVPEPASVGLGGLVLIALGLRRHR